MHRIHSIFKKNFQTSDRKCKFIQINQLFKTFNKKYENCLTDKTFSCIILSNILRKLYN